MSQKQYQLIFLSLVAAAALLFASWIVNNTIQHRIEKTVKNSLDTVLNTTHHAITQWAQQELAIVETWSDNLNVRSSAEALLATPRDTLSLLASPAQEALRKQLLPIMTVKGYKGYFIIDHNNISLASSHNVNIGSENLLAGEKAFLERIWSGYPAMSQPIRSDVPLSPIEERRHMHVKSMFAGAPILNSEYEVIAVFVIRIDPHQVFTSILRQGQIGKSGETYAFNRKGEMISLSRFDEKLHQIGLIAGDDKDTSHLIYIRDPGVNLISGQKAVLPRKKQPLTLMAEQAVQGLSGGNMKGYRDYRGVMVVGSWLWDEQLQMGFTTEMDEEEAKGNAHYIRNAIAIFSLLILLMLLGLMLVFDRGRQQIMRQSRELRTIINAAPVAMVLTDNQGNIEFFNRMFIRQYGWTTDDIRTPGQWWRAVYPDKTYRLKVQQGWEQAVAQAQREQCEIAPQQWSIACKNGQQRETEFRMVPVSEKISVIAMVDLTERNRAMRTIRFERDRAQSYLDTVDVIILALDPHGTITQINRAGCELLGYEEEELIGKNWFECCLSLEERERLMDTVHATAMEQDEEHTSYVENEVITHSGVKRLIAWRNAQLSDEQGNVIGSLSAGADITEIRRAEQERERLFEQLQRTQKAEAIGQLSAGVSHNFNNIFGSIIGFLGLAKRKADSDDDEDMKRYLDEALRSSHRARDLVAQIASFSRKSSVDIHPTDLSDVLNRAVGLLNNILPSAILVRVDCGTHLPLVLLDEEHFQQVLANLLNNASDAMAGEGAVNIACHSVNVTDQHCHSCEGDFEGDFVVVEIRDIGDGMSPEIQRRIFEPFFTTRDVGHGTGMGLPVVHGIIHNLGGHIQVESSEGEGTVITLYLPVVS